MRSSLKTSVQRISNNTMAILFQSLTGIILPILLNDKTLSSLNQMQSTKTPTPLMSIGLLARGVLMRVRCSMDILFFDEMRQGQISDFMNLTGLSLVPKDNYYTFEGAGMPQAFTGRKKIF